MAESTWAQARPVFLVNVTFMTRGRSWLPSCSAAGHRIKTEGSTRVFCGISQNLPQALAPEAPPDEVGSGLVILGWR